MGKYYVYKCFVDNKLRYVGKGKGDRYKHTISGRSTCAKLNKAFFDGKEIKVKIFKWGLTEEQALFEESTLINLNVNSLWNQTKGGILLKEPIKNDADAKYKITSPEGEEFFINSYKAFCKRHNRSHTFGQIIAERNKYKKELNILKANAYVTIDKRPNHTLRERSSNSLSAVEVNNETLKLTLSEKEALNYALSQNCLDKNFWFSTNAGQVKEIDSNHEIFPRGFLTGLKKLLHNQGF